jgi:hypothetical protein
VLVDELVRQDAQALYPQEYLNLLETFEHGEAVLHVQGDEQKADVFYLLVLQKGALLKNELLWHRQRKAQEERDRIAAEAARVERERLMRRLWQKPGFANRNSGMLRWSAVMLHGRPGLPPTLLLPLYGSKHLKSLSSNGHSATRFAVVKPCHRLQPVLKYTTNPPCGR